MTRLSTILAAGLITTAAAAPAFAQAQSIAIVNPEAAIEASTAWQNATQAIQTTYATQIQQAQQRSTALQTELQTLRTALETAAQAEGATQQSVAPQQQAFVQKQQQAQAELQQLQRPIALARTYAQEQIAVQLQPAVSAAMQQKNVDLVLRPEASVLFVNPEVNLTDEVTAELNRRVQSVAVQPPANWQPGQTIGAQQQQTAQSQN